MAFLNRISYKMTQLDNPFLQVMNIKSIILDIGHQLTIAEYMYVCLHGLILIFLLPMPHEWIYTLWLIMKSTHLR